MDASDGDRDYVPNTIPELIDHLWQLHRELAQDPALETCRDHIRQAAINLEEVRRVAFEVYEEEQRKTNPLEKGGSDNGKKQKRHLEQDWLSTVPLASPLKH